MTGPEYNKALEDITNMGFDKELVKLFYWNKGGESS